MKIQDISYYLFESYKDAQEKFAQEASEDEVKQYLDTFKQLAKKGMVSGQEKDIGYWIKQGWNEFKGFVDSKSQEKSKSQVKKSKKSDSIIAHEDEEKVVVIPLTKDASCYYGKNTKWCTSATESENYFIEYFYIENIVLFYVFMKNSNKKYAAAYFINEDKVKYFDDMDISIGENGFKDKTGINRKQIDNWYNKNKPIINKAIDLNHVSEDIQIEVIKEDGFSIKYIDNPSEELKTMAVIQNGRAIKYIDNPSEETQLEAVLTNSNSIKFIKNPTEKVQIKAMKQNGLSIQYIPNPSEEVQIEAVKQNFQAINYIDNPSEKVQLEMVRKNPHGIQYINNPSEKVQIEAVKENYTSIAKINNPTDQVIKQYEQLTGKSYTNPEQIQKDEMNDLDDFVQSLKK